MADNKTQIIITAKDETRASIASAQAGMQALASQTAALGLNLAALGGCATGGALAMMAKNAIDAADAIGKTAQKVGITAESLSALSYAGKLSDVSMEQLSQGLKKLSVNLNDIATGGNTDAAAALKALGISARDSSGNLRNADSVFADVAESFAGMEDGAGKTALAVALFGKAGSEMIPMLNSGRDGLRDAADEAQRFGLIIGSDAAKAAEEFNDNLTRISSASQGMGQIIAGEVLPPLSQLAQEMVNSAKESDGFASTIGGALRTGLEATIIVVSNAVSVFKLLGRELGGLAAQYVALSTLDFKGFKAIGDGMREDVAKTIAEMDAFQQRIRNPPGKLDVAVDGYGYSPWGGKGTAPTFAPTKNSSEISEGARLIQQMRDRLYTAQELSEVEKLQGQLADGRYKKMSEGERDVALSLAAQIDARKSINKELDEELKRVNEMQQAQKEEASRLASLVGNTERGKNIQKMADEALAESALRDGRIDQTVYDQIVTKLHEVKKEGKDAFEELQQAVEGWGKAAADAMVEFAFTGKMSFGDMVNSMLKDMAKMVVYQNITKPMSEAFSGMFSGFFKGGGGAGEMDFLANGGVYNSPGLSAYSGQVVSSPTVFPFANGIGLMGEAGAEAILPLKRGKDGKLGVSAGDGMGGGVNVSVNVDASNNEKVSSDNESGADLGRKIGAAVRAVLVQEKRNGGLLAA